MCVLPGKGALSKRTTGFVGRMTSIQTIHKSKRHKYSMKMYMLAEPKEIIFLCLGLHKITGQSKWQCICCKCNNEVKGWKDKHGCSLYTDNFYSSQDLVLWLLPTALEHFILIVKVIPHYRLNHNSQRVNICVNKPMMWLWQCGKTKQMFCSSWQNLKLSWVTHLTWEDKDWRSQEYNSKTNVSHADWQDQIPAYYPCHGKTIWWCKKTGTHIF
jgi:hypothetical protein